MATAGRILIMPKGDYNASVTYEMLDMVSYNGTTWLAKKTVTGIAPTKGEYWHSLFDIDIDDLNSVNEEIKKLKSGEVSTFKDYTLAENFFGRKIGRDVTLYLTGYTVTNTAAGNGGDVGDALQPLFDVIVPVFIDEYGLAVMVINTDGNISLYSADMTRFISGTIRGTVSYKTQNVNL